jgi:predicted lipoprotein with Yx(FWY)xxD motif
MRKSITGAIAASILSICVAAALAQTAPAKSADTSKGKALVDAKGLTLYTFDRDATGKSNCNGACATNWPPLVAGADAKASGDWTIVTRDDGGKQWAYKGKPLYEFAKDTKPGDVTATASTASGTSPRRKLRGVAQRWI